LQDQVIALGGGALERAANRAALADSGHRVVYLQCDAEELHRRISADPRSAAARPGLTSLDALAEVRHLLARREPIYRQAMHVPLDVTRLSPEQAAQRIADWLTNAP
jgi:shikimate kinase